MTVNQRIRHYRKKLKYTQADVAKMLDMKISTYSQMERMGNITCETLIKLTDILKTDALTLLYGEKMLCKEIPKIEEIKKDIDGIPMLIADDLYEKFAVIAMRNLSHNSKQEVYGFIMEKLKNLNNIKV